MADLGALPSALGALGSLEDLVLDLSGFDGEKIPEERRRELQGSVRQLGRRRGRRLVTWVHIEGLPPPRPCMPMPAWLSGRLQELAAR